jgi:hypothetical protein
MHRGIEFRITLILGLSLLLILSCNILGTQMMPNSSSQYLDNPNNNDSIPAGIIWSDDFNDGNFQGWSVTRGGYSATENLIRGTTTTWNYIEHPSTVAHGTWSFDHNFYAGLDGIWQPVDGDLAIWFIANGHQSGDTTQADNGYFLVFHPHVDAIELWMDPGDEGYNRVLLGSWTPPDFVKWWHVEITRDSDGEFKVYLDDVLRIQATDTTYDSSIFFGFLGYNQQEMDNVVVSDSVPSTTSTATTTTNTVTDTVTTSVATTTTTSTSTNPPPTGLSVDPMLMAGILLILAIVIGGIIVFSRRKPPSPSSKEYIQQEPPRPPPSSTPVDTTEQRELVLGALRSYPRVSMDELSNLLNIPVEDTRKITLRLIATGEVSGAFDRSMDEFVSVDATRIGRDLRSDGTGVGELATCPHCGAPLQRRFGAGETIICPSCGKSFTA